MKCNITKIRLRSYICASIDVFLPSISSLKSEFKTKAVDNGDWFTYTNE